MTSLNLTLQPRSEGTLPTSLWIALLAVFAALGIVLRQVTIPTFSPYVTLTPGFIMPLLAGMVLGPLGGILCGVFVGISGAFWEPYLIPIFGNIALGLSTGVPAFYRQRFHPYLWSSLCIVSAIFIGGFLPTFSIEVLVALVPVPIAAMTASIDAVQAGVWVIFALLIVKVVVDPILHRYRRVN